MASSLRIALPYVLKHEGGWSDDPVDPGGATNFGITLATAKRHGITSAEDLERITLEQVEAIYRADYWRFDAVDDQRVATKLFDMAVNMGLGTAVRIAQRIAVDLGADDDLVDGRFGPWTTMALNAVRPEQLLPLLCARSADYYRGIVARRPESVKFLRGWLKRAAEVPE